MSSKETSPLVGTVAPRLGLGPFSRLAALVAVAFTVGLMCWSATASPAAVGQAPAAPMNMYSSVAIQGKYSFESSSYYADYLKAKNVGMILRSVLVKERPDLIIESDATKYTLTFFYSLKTIKISFTLGVPFQADFYFNFVERVVATVRDGNTLVLTRLDDASEDTYVFSDAGIAVTYKANDGTTATATFHRA